MLTFFTIFNKATDGKLGHRRLFEIPTLYSNYFSNLKSIKKDDKDTEVVFDYLLKML